MSDRLLIMDEVQVAEGEAVADLNVDRQEWLKEACAMMPNGNKRETGEKVGT